MSYLNVCISDHAEGVPYPVFSACTQHAQPGHNTVGHFPTQHMWNGE